MQHSDAPYKELQLARESIGAMQSAASLEEFESAWKEFLRRLERVWSKSENHFGRSPKWSGWHGRWLKLRRDDPLLSYLKNARDAEEHTVEEIVQRHPGGVGIGPASGSSLHIDHLSISNGAIHLKTKEPHRITFIQARIALLPVSNRGRTYGVPTRHLNKVVDSDDVVSIAQAGVDFYQGFFEKAEDHFVPKDKR